MNPIDNFEMTPYHDAIANKNHEVAQLLKAHSGVVVHRDLGYKLCNAGFEGDLALLQALSSKGAMLNTADYDLRTALHLAACEGHTECVVWLLKQNADKNVKDCFKHRPIDDAAKNQHTEIVRLLADDEAEANRMSIKAINLSTAQSRISTNAYPELTTQIIT